MNAMCEMLETRSLMSATVGTTELAADGGNVETTALLLPAVQAAREAARSSAASGPGGGPSVKVFSGNAGTNAAGGHVGGINVCLADGSVR